MVCPYPKQILNVYLCILYPSGFLIEPSTNRLIPEPAGDRDRETERQKGQRDRETERQGDRL